MKCKYCSIHESEKKEKKTEFSKLLLVSESLLIWVVTLSFIALSFFCISNQFFGELPWLTAMAAFPWAAYGVGQGFYYKKAEKENTKGGIKYDTVMLKHQYDEKQKDSNYNAVG